MVRRRLPGLAACLVVAALVLAGCTQSGPPIDEDGPVRTDTVLAKNELVFEPEWIEVVNGTTVTWRSQGARGHTVTFRSDENISFDVEIKPGESTNLTFNRTGTYDYYCRFHAPDMVGRVTVVPAPGDGNATDGNPTTGNGTTPGVAADGGQPAAHRNRHAGRHG